MRSATQPIFNPVNVCHLAHRASVPFSKPFEHQLTCLHYINIITFIKQTCNAIKKISTSFDKIYFPCTCVDWHLLYYLL